MNYFVLTLLDRQVIPMLKTEKRMTRQKYLDFYEEGQPPFHNYLTG